MRRKSGRVKSLNLAPRGTNFGARGRADYRLRNSIWLILEMFDSTDRIIKEERTMMPCLSPFHTLVPNKHTAASGLRIGRTDCACQLSRGDGEQPCPQPPPRTHPSDVHVSVCTAAFPGASSGLITFPWGLASAPSHHACAHVSRRPMRRAIPKMAQEHRVPLRKPASPGQRLVQTLSQTDGRTHIV